MPPPPASACAAASGCRRELDAANEGGVVGLGLLRDVLRHSELLDQLFFAGFVAVERWEHLFVMLQFFSAGEGQKHLVQVVDEQLDLAPDGDFCCSRLV